MCFKISAPKLLASFFDKSCHFFPFFLTFIVIFPVFQPDRESPLGFDNKLRENVFWPWNKFQILSSQIFEFFYATCNFFQVF